MAELNLDILPKIESLMAQGILAKLFDQCAIDADTAVPERTGLGRQLQRASLEGLSIRPRDTVIEEGE